METLMLDQNKRANHRPYEIRRIFWLPRHSAASTIMLVKFGVFKALVSQTMHCVCLSQKNKIQNSSDVSLFSGEEGKTCGPSLQNA